MAASQDIKQIAVRYASALFELAAAEDALEKTHNELLAIGELLQQSAEFRALCFSPTLDKQSQHEGLKLLAEHAKLSLLVSRFLLTLADNRRVYCLPYVVTVFGDMLRQHKGQIVAEVVTAAALKKAQQNTLAKLLAKYTGKDVILDIKQDNSVLGGLLVQVDGKMIDATIAGRLSRLRDRLYDGIHQIG